MRRVQFETFGEPSAVLHVREVPTPPPGPGQALVRMRARPVHPTDLNTVRGLGRSLPLPATPGLEGVGVIEALGPGVDGFHVGQRVIPFLVGEFGTWQEYVSVEAAALIPAPETISDAAAAQVIINPLTARVMTLEELALGEGQWVLQTAASSALGRVVVQLGRLYGFQTINVVRRREQVELLKAVGAEQVICTADEDLLGRVMEITRGAGVSAAMDAVAGALSAQLVRALAPGGVLLLYGRLSFEPIALDPTPVIFRALTVRGFSLPQWVRNARPERVQAAVGEVLRLVVAHDVVLPVGAEYDLGDIQAAVRQAEWPGRSGKVLLVG